MPSNYNCKYGRVCAFYEHESIRCCFLYNFCKQKRGQDRQEEERKIKDLAEHLIKLSGQMK